MIQIINKAECSGCQACRLACPRQCITMVRDEEGFLYPCVDESQCIQCGLCERVCQSIHPIESADLSKAYAAYSLNKDIQEKSSSGGIFTLLAEAILEKGGVVFGAAYDVSFEVRHVYVRTKEDLGRLRGSKYVQSNIGTSYRDAENFLKNGVPVLFTGTPCQIDGLLHYLRKPYSQLYTQDVICHGVPSPMVWKQYIKEIETLHDAKISSVSLKYKVPNWKNYSVKFTFDNGEESTELMGENLYMRGFLLNLYLRPSCYSCHSKGMIRNSDITLADFWGVEQTASDMFNEKGTSLIIVHTERGESLLDEILPQLHIKNVNFQEAIMSNSSYFKSSECPEQRGAVLSELKNNGFSVKYLAYIKKMQGNFLINIGRQINRKLRQVFNRNRK